MSWAQLLKRVFAIDITTCPQCGGPLTILAAIEEPAVIAKILSAPGLAESRATPGTRSPRRILPDSLIPPLIPVPFLEPTDPLCPVTQPTATNGVTGWAHPRKMGPSGPTHRRNFHMSDSKVWGLNPQHGFWYFAGRPPLPITPAHTPQWSANLARSANNGLVRPDSQDERSHVGQQNPGIDPSTKSLILCYSLKKAFKLPIPPRRSLARTYAPARTGDATVQIPKAGPRIPDTPWTHPKSLSSRPLLDAGGQLSALTDSGVSSLAGRRVGMRCDATTLQSGSISASCR